MGLDDTIPVPETARPSLPPHVTNLTDLVESGRYSDILAAIEGEAVDGATLYIEGPEPGSGPTRTYDVATPARVENTSNVRIYTSGYGSKWNANTFPVELNWTGAAGETMLTIATNGSGVDGWSIEGIDFNGNLGTAAEGVLWESDGNQNRDHRLERCGFRDFSGRPFGRSGSNPAEAYDVEFRECSVFRPGTAGELPAQSEWYGGYVVVNNPGSHTGADYGLETATTCDLYGLTAAPGDGRTAVNLNLSTWRGGHIESADATATAGLECKNYVNVGGGRITGCDVGIHVGDPNDSTVDCLGYIGPVRIQNHGTNKLQLHGDANSHNGLVVVDGGNWYSTSTFTTSDAHSMAWITPLQRGGIATADLMPGMIVFDPSANELVVGDSDGDGHYFTPDGAA